MLSVESKGDFKNIEAFLARLPQKELIRKMSSYGDRGVDALRRATPIDSGETASSWYYTIKEEKGSFSIIWGNRHVSGGTPIAIFIQYGHGTRTGGYIQGRDFINPAIQPIFDKIAADVWKEVTK